MRHIGALVDEVGGLDEAREDYPKLTKRDLEYARLYASVPTTRPTTRSAVRLLLDENLSPRVAMMGHADGRRVERVYGNAC